MSKKKNRFNRGVTPPGNAIMFPPALVQAMIANMQPGKGQADAFSPGAPLQPYPGLTPKTGPRTYNYPISYNTSVVDRTRGSQDIPSFMQLRSLAALYSGIGLCERVWLDMVPKLAPSLQLSPSLVAGGAQGKDYQKDMSVYLKFFDKPDKINDFHSWLRMALREQTQIDALCLYKHPTRGGDLYALEMIDATMIKPLINERGMQPQPPWPAWEQFAYDVPASFYTTEQMIYYRETPSVFTQYGFSRVERIIMEVNQALRKKKKDLLRYTEGNIPAGIIEVPEASNWTPDQIDTYEQMWNSMLAGNAQQQVRVKFMQPGMKYTRTDEEIIQTEFDQFLLNITAAAYGVSMADLAITGDIHKSSDQGQQNMLYRRTLEPITAMYAAIFTQVLQEDFHDNRFIFAFKGYEEQTDLQSLATTYSMLIQNAVISPAQVARVLNLPDIPETGPLFITKAGITPLAQFEEGSDLREASDDAQLAGLKMAQNPQQENNNEEDDNTPPPKPQKRSNDYKRWRARAIDDVRSQRPLRAFTSTEIPIDIQTRLQSELERCATADDVRAVFASLQSPQGELLHA